MDTLIAYLQSVIRLDTADLALLTNIARPMQVGRRSFLLEPGETSRQIYFVSSGWFRLYDIDTNGNQENRRFTFEGQFAVDFQSFLSQQPSRYYLQAMQQAEVLAITYKDLQSAYDQSKGWERLGRLLAERGYQQLNERVELMRLHTPEERYQYVLDTHPELPGRVSLAQLASYLGIRPESLSRLRKRMVKK